MEITREWKAIDVQQYINSLPQDNINYVMDAIDGARKSGFFVHIYNYQGKIIVLVEPEYFNRIINTPLPVDDERWLR